MLKREYGSHGSINVLDRPGGAPGSTSGSTNESSFFAMLQDYRPIVLEGISTDQRSPGPAEYLRSKIDVTDGIGASAVAGVDGTGHTPQSPRSRVKLSKLFQKNGGSSSGSTAGGGKQMNGVGKGDKAAMDDCGMSTSGASTNSMTHLSADAEEIARRRAFAHYDVQSLTTNLSYSVRMRRNLLSRRRNTTTGASAASMLAARSSTPDGGSDNNGLGSGDEDLGDGQSNDLVESCPFFRNEIGGEEERIVSLTRQHSQYAGQSRGRPLHRPTLAYGVNVLEFPAGETHWRQSTCPYQRLPRPIESVDQGALYYKYHFMGNEHQNWFGMDDQLGPVVISIRREKVPPSDHIAHALTQYQYRVIIRTSELLTLRGTILEDAIPNIKISSSSSNPTKPPPMNTVQLLEHITPEIQVSCLRLGVQTPHTEEQLQRLDEQGLTNTYKVGVMYCRAGQSSEEEMYNNEHAGPAFEEFLHTIGKTVKLAGFKGYKAGLDNKSNSTGEYSIHSQYQDCEVMFHVSTMLPFTPNNRQQLLRKRHIGNDIVTVVFQEPGALPFTPRGIRSQFQHVFVVVRAINPCTENTHYAVAVSRSKDVQVFGPPIKEGAVFPKGKAFAEFLLAKVVNAENAAHRSEKFVTMATRTRQEYLKDIINNCSTSTVVDTGQKFSIFTPKRKPTTHRPRFIPDATQRGALLWQVLLDDRGQSRQIECYLGISVDTFLLVEEEPGGGGQIVFVTPCKSILGWASQTNGLRVYYHQGECVTVHMRGEGTDRDELMEVMERLKVVTQGIQVQELSLKRNIMGQLGFHVQPDGIVTLVESAGQAWQAGLRQNSRLVEICKVAVSTLTYDQMVDLLKTSTFVTLTVIPPLPDGSARKGCTLQNCKYKEATFDGDYENVEEQKNRKAPHQAVPGNHRKFYDRSFSPPRSSNSSGYGTGSSSKSFLGGTTTTVTTNATLANTESNRYISSQNNETSRYNSQNNDSNRYHAPNSNNIMSVSSMEGNSMMEKGIIMDNTGTITSSSSGGLSDDRWYDSLHEQLDLDVPVLPLKKSGSGVVLNGGGTPKRVGGSSAGHSYAQNVQHGKLQVSHSLPLQHVNFSQPMTATISHSSTDYKLNDKSLSKHHHDKHDYRSKGSDYTSITQLTNDGHSTDSSISDHRLYGAGGSEEELSGNGSGNDLSPGSRRNKYLGMSSVPTTLTHSATNSRSHSRNQSPRSIPDNANPNLTTSNGAGAKLRPGVLTRNANRNSANLNAAASTNLQEELIRLITTDTNGGGTGGGSVPTTPTTDEGRSIVGGRGEYKECGGGGDRERSGRDRDKQPEVILTTARPATVISNSSTTSSPLPNPDFRPLHSSHTHHHHHNPLQTSNSMERLNSKKLTAASQHHSNNGSSKGNLSSGKGGIVGEAMPLPDDIDWPSLVDTATRVVGGAAVEADGVSRWSEEEDIMEAAAVSLNVSSCASLPELQNHLTELESRVSRETRRRLSLENEVRRLKDENRKLQDQAHTAVQQLRKFTEWFFKNVQRQ